MASTFKIVIKHTNDVIRKSSMPSSSMTKSGQIHQESAQLAHYGIPLSTTKQAAKAALLEAYESEQGLIVPQHILQCEERLRAQYRAKEARLLEEEEERWRKQCQQEEKQRVKRKRQEDDLIAEIEEANASKKKHKGEPVMAPVI
ncbi:MAG: hypothetical protein Q9198_005896 [Flavoplaca austrocitrina]